MARNPTIDYSLTYVDQSGEKSTTGFQITAPVDLTAWPDTDYAALEAAIAGVTNGLLTARRSGETMNVSNAKVGPAGANREDKILITMQDDTTLVPYSFTLPCRDNTLNPVSGTDYYNLSVTPWSTLKSAVELVWRSPDGNAGTMESAKLVGRNV